MWPDADGRNAIHDVRPTWRELAIGGAGGAFRDREAVVSEATKRGTPDARTLLRLDRQGSTALPLHEQVYRQLRARIESGALLGGSRLPAARVVAAELGVARNTVDAALLRLQQDGLIVRRAGAGSVVADGVALISVTPLTRFVRGHRIGRDTLKVYAIAAPAAFPEDDLVAAALDAALATAAVASNTARDSAHELSGDRIPQPARIGSLIIHVRHDRVLLMLGLWQDDGLLQYDVWTAAAGPKPIFQHLTGGAVPVTSEALPIFTHEAGAWERYTASMRDRDADDAWLADVSPGASVR